MGAETRGLARKSRNSISIIIIIIIDMFINPHLG